MPIEGEYMAENLANKEWEPKIRCHRLQLVYLRRSRSGGYQQNSVSAECAHYPRSLHGKN